ncbi:MAG: CBASS cGAMP synthase [Methylocystis sp.]|jgi:hypothetical protein
MGSAATLFFNANDSEKQTLHRRITPSDEQFEEQQERWNVLADHLTSDLKERSGHSIRTWLQGSYKFGTQIRPVHMGHEFDIDLGIYYQWEGEPEEGTHGPCTLKSFVQRSLQDYARDNADSVLEVCPPKTRCCRIRYNNSFHIDVPAYHLDPDRDARTLATEERWECSDPKAIYVWFKDQFDDATRARVRRQIKYLKSWAALKFDENGRPSSILLTVLVADAAKSIGAAGVVADDETLRNILESLVARLDGDKHVPNPVCETENLARLSDTEMNSFIERLKGLLEIANRAVARSTESAAADVWQEAFEHLFPMPAVTEVLTEAARYLPVPLTMPEILVTAVSRDNAALGKYNGMNKIGPIPKNCDVNFEIINGYALPHGAEIFWIVRNEGREAENINDLGHLAGTGLVATEHSAYRGTHHMDCVVKVAGQTVAMRRVPVDITGKELPRRNPLQKPAWVRLRGRR